MSAPLLLLLLAVSATAKKAPATYDKNLCLICCEQGNTACPTGCPPCLLSTRGQCPFIDRRVCCRCPIRRVDCDGDADCGRGQRCCVGACSRRCTPACFPPCGGGRRCLRTPIGYYICVGKPKPPPACPGCKPGQCPQQICFSSGTDRCSTDADCFGGLRCCRYCSGRSCVPPCLPGCPPGKRCELDMGFTCRGRNCASTKRPRHHCV